jgi:hypothetical protein
MLQTAKRQARTRVLEALDELIKQFRRREELWPLRVPNEPVLLEEVVERALGGRRQAVRPEDLRSRSLLQLEWEDGSVWEAWMAVLPSGFKLYCDSTADETRILASGGRNEGEETDRIFLQQLAASAGAHFGIEMAGGAPCRVRSPVADPAFLTDLFVELFEVIGAESSVRGQLGPDAERSGRARDFRDDVARWLAAARPTPHPRRRT